MQNVIVWNIDPVIFSWGILTIRWYGLFFACVFLIGGFIGSWMFKREAKPPESLDRLLMHMIFGVVIGARLGHVIFYDPVFYFTHPTEIIMIWRGGLSSHGGGIGLITAIFLYSRKTPDQPFLWVLDRTSFEIALGASIIRIGNLFNSEILGKPTGSDWGVIFQRHDSIPRHPTQVYESMSYFFFFMVLLFLYSKTDIGKKPGMLSGVFLVTMLPARLFLEFLKEIQSGFEAGWILNMGQILSIPFILFGIYLLLRNTLFDSKALNT